MGYEIEIDSRTVIPYLREHFVLADRLSLVRTLQALRDAAERYRSDSSFRYRPGSPMIVLDYLFLDLTDRLRHVRFIVTDSAAQYGILRVAYVDEY